MGGEGKGGGELQDKGGIRSSFFLLFYSVVLCSITKHDELAQMNIDGQISYHSAETREITIVNRQFPVHRGKEGSDLFQSGNSFDDVLQ